MRWISTSEKFEQTDVFFYFVDLVLNREVQPNILCGSDLSTSQTPLPGTVQTPLPGIATGKTPLPGVALDQTSSIGISSDGGKAATGVQSVGESSATSAASTNRASTGTKDPQTFSNSAAGMESGAPSNTAGGMAVIPADMTGDAIGFATTNGKSAVDNPTDAQGSSVGFPNAMTSSTALTPSSIATNASGIPPNVIRPSIPYNAPYNAANAPLYFPGYATVMPTSVSRGQVGVQPSVGKNGADFSTNAVNQNVGSIESTAGSAGRGLIAEDVNGKLPNSQQIKAGDGLSKTKISQERDLDKDIQSHINDLEKKVALFINFS